MNRDYQSSAATLEYSEEELRASAKAACEEMKKYKWHLGEVLGHDPEKDRPRYEIYAEWVKLHAATFRQNWDEQQNQH